MHGFSQCCERSTCPSSFVPKADCELCYDIIDDDTSLYSPFACGNGRAVSGCGPDGQDAYQLKAGTGASFAPPL